MILEYAITRPEVFYPLITAIIISVLFGVLAVFIGRPVNFKKVTEKLFHDYDHNPDPVVWRVLTELGKANMLYGPARVAWVDPMGVPLEYYKPRKVYFLEEDIEEYFYSRRLPKYFISYPRKYYKRAKNANVKNYLIEEISLK